jgi:hypothetical protein
MDTGAGTALVRRVNLADADWGCIAWRHRQAPVPTPRSFDFESRMKCVRPHLGSFNPAFKVKRLVPARLSKEEAWFWLRCLDVTERRGRQNVQPFPHPDEALPDDEEVRVWARDVAQRSSLIYHEVPQTLLPFFNAAEIAVLILDKAALGTCGSWGADGHLRLMLGFAKWIAPYLGEWEREDLRCTLERLYDTEPETPRATLLLALLSTVGGGVRLTSYVARQPEEGWGRRARSIRTGHLDMLAGLDCEASFLREAHRLRCFPQDAAEMRLWLAATEWRALAPAADAVITAGTTQRALPMARILALVEAPEAASPMLQLELQSRKAATAAAEWFVTHPLHAIVGLVPAAMQVGVCQEAARERLRAMRCNDRADAFRAAWLHLTPEQAAWLQREILEPARHIAAVGRAELPEELRAAFARVATVSLPGWLAFASLPPIRVQGRVLGAIEVDRVLAALKRKPEGSAAVPIMRLKAHADPTSLDTFAWELFEHWEKACKLPKDRWAMLALGRLGGDGCVLQLARRVHAWSRKGQRALALLALTCLRANGGAAALMTLKELPRTLSGRRKAQVIKDRAREMIAEIARSRCLTPEQLDDRIVPDCGLDVRGTRLLDFGARELRCELGSGLELRVRDPAGRLRPRLPAPARADDPDRAANAAAEWKLMKAVLREVRKVQVERLEEAMISCRRWTGEEFRTLILEHPVMLQLVRELVLAEYDAADRVIRTFRIAEDQRFLGWNDQETSLSPAARVGVVHPLQLDDVMKAQWGRVVGDYHIIPPFTQLGRDVYLPDPQELESLEITRFCGPRVMGIVLYSLLKRNRWQHEAAAQFLPHHWRPFPSAGVTALIRYTGLNKGKYGELQEIQSLCFIPAGVPPDAWHDSRLKIRDVNPVVLSEALRMAHILLARAQ